MYSKTFAILLPVTFFCLVQFSGCSVLPGNKLNPLGGLDSHRDNGEQIGRISQPHGHPGLKPVGLNNISEGWDGLSWGVTIETFRKQHPCCRYTKGDHLIDSGEGNITFCRIGAKPLYAFNASGRFYQVMLVPDMIHRPNIDPSLLNSMDLNPNEDGMASRGPIRVEVNRRFRIILITNTDYEM